MTKKILYLSFFFFLSILINAHGNVFISVTIDDEIITNVDLEKENSYLKILNPNLSQLDKESINKISKKSLIEERIKKKEIKKFIIEHNLYRFLLKKGI